MALFWSKKQKAEKNYQQSAAPAAKAARAKGAKASKTSSRAVAPAKAALPAQAAVPALPSGSFSSATDVIIRPRVTEKSGILSQGGVYTFEVAHKANKQSIAKAVKALYKVNPVKVTVLNMPAKATFIRGKRGHVSSFRKAMVTVKKGEKIDFV